VAAIPQRRWPPCRPSALAATVVGDHLYGDLEAEARKRLGARDPED
jgi:hypothetical protein